MILVHVIWAINNIWQVLSFLNILEPDITTIIHDNHKYDTQKKKESLISNYLYLY